MSKRLKFWGTRGSCSVSGPEYREYGGNGPCMELHFNDAHLIFDAGTGIRPLGKTLSHLKKIDLFISHFHLDHIIGFPFFAPIYEKDVSITIYTPVKKKGEAEALFNQLFGHQFFPIHLNQTEAKLIFVPVEEKKPIQIGEITIDFHETLHPATTLCFKINTPNETIGYVTDNEIDLEKQKSLIEFFQNVDLFIHEAQYSKTEYKEKKGWGHSSLNLAIDLIKKIQPKKWYITHHDPDHTDEDLKKLELQAKTLKLECPAIWLKDYDTIDLK